MQTSSSPKLAPPGAGLPLPELFFARIIFSGKRLLGTRETFSSSFLREQSAILELVTTSKPENRGVRVLIPRLRGLEDSSRNWSVWMTLEHLRITNDAFAKIIHSLANNEVPPGKASTADVKPGLSVDAGVEAGFEKSCGELIARVRKIANLKTKMSYAHPWFGALNAEGWHALSAMHMSIHRAQISRILRLLDA